MKLESDLKFVTTEQLISELCERCAPSVFIGRKNEGGLIGDATWYEYNGAKPVCYGMCHQMAYLIQNDEEEDN